jgi:hypothetical protein
LPTPLESPQEQWLYRRITPTSWDRRRGMPEPGAFKRRRAEQGLSVFRADRQTPRGVLQACIDDQEQKLQSADPEERARTASFTSQYGSTVESLIEAGWRVARIPVSAFTQRGFIPGEPDAAGHMEVSGEYEDFARYSRELRAAAELLPIEECLRG